MREEGGREGGWASARAPRGPLRRTCSTDISGPGPSPLPAPPCLSLCRDWQVPRAPTEYSLFSSLLCSSLPASWVPKMVALTEVKHVWHWVWWVGLLQADSSKDAPLPWAQGAEAGSGLTAPSPEDPEKAGKL